MTQWKVLGLSTSVVALAVVVGGLVAAPSSTDCHQVPATKDGEHWFQAADTVVEPWFGRHHVYGVFTIPVKYKFDHLFTAKLVIQGTSQEFLAGSPEDEETSRSPWFPGYYRKRVYLSTRTAMRFLMAGRFGDLRSTCHWWLVISNR